MFSTTRCSMCGHLLPYEIMDAQIHLEHCRRFVELTESSSSPSPSSSSSSSSVTSKFVSTSISHNVQHPHWRCPICNHDGNGQSTEKRLRHIKRCGQKYGIRAQEMSIDIVIQKESEEPPLSLSPSNAQIS